MKQAFLNLSHCFKQQQKRNALLAVGFIVFLFFVFWVFDKTELPPQSIVDKTPLHDLTQSIEDKNIWMFQAANRLEAQEKKQDQLLKEIEELKKAFTEQQSNNKEEASNLPTPGLMDGSMPDAFESHHSSYFESSVEETPAQTERMQQNTSSIFSAAIPLTHSNDKQSPHQDHYIPAGSYAKAVLLSGVDVSAGVSSQASPKPVLLRLIHPGSLPNKAIGKMKDCRVIAAAFGDLSSERAYLRLEKLSCIEPDGHVIETDVDGYISGEDGKNGIRGRVIMRDNEVLRRGFLGGLLSGFGKASSQSFNTSSVSPFGAVQTSSARGLDIFKQAGAEGTGNAFDLMAKYHIQRAEQYQPVIQISAGRKVDVVFHSGAPFGEKRTPQKSLDSLNLEGNQP